MRAEVVMSATILPFERRQYAGPEGGARMPPLRPPAIVEDAAVPLPLPRLETGVRLTPREVAHRWTMLAHLARRYPKPAGSPRVR
jgi:hypothetical protein